MERVRISESRYYQLLDAERENAHLKQQREAELYLDRMINDGGYGANIVYITKDGLYAKGRVPFNPRDHQVITTQERTEASFTITPESSNPIPHRNYMRTGDHICGKTVYQEI